MIKRIACFLTATALLLAPLAAFAQSAASGTVGNPASTQAGQVAGRDGSGVLRVPRVSSAGAVSVDGSGSVYSILGSRPFTPLTGTVANGTSAYSTGQVIGSLVTVATGLPAGTIITAGNIRFRIRVADTTTGPAFAMMIFNANPSGSTITDGVALNIVAADRDKTVGPQGGLSSFASLTGGVYQTNATLPRMTVDGSGNIYFLIGAIGATQFSAATTIGWQIDGTY